MYKVKCDKCQDMAVWTYAPDGRFNYCDKCITSPNDVGCSCNWNYTSDELPVGEKDVNWRWVDEEKGIWLSLDDKGRPFPCSEFFYDEDGFEA